MVDNTGIDETLSALMDSEAGELEVRRVLRDISRDSELRDRWHRYQLAASAMKGDLPPRMTDLSASISTALERESTHHNRLKTALEPLGKVAIAASVALVAVLGVQQVQQIPVGAKMSPAEVAGSVGEESGVEEESGAAEFQLPASMDLPPVAARTASAGSRYETSQSKPMLVVSRRERVELKNEAAIRSYLNAMMERHTRNAANVSSNQGLLPLARLPQAEDN